MLPSASRTTVSTDCVLLWRVAKPTPQGEFNWQQKI
jgi:hypothetical protein